MENYKKLVLEKYPKAHCKGITIRNRIHYYIFNGNKKISSAYYLAQDAWNDVYEKLNS